MRRLLSIMALTLVMTTVKAQKMTMTEAIETARQQSVAALEARHAFISTYWSWRSYKASRLPSLHFYGDLMNYTARWSCFRTMRTEHSNMPVPITCKTVWASV